MDCPSELRTTGLSLWMWECVTIIMYETGLHRTDRLHSRAHLSKWKHRRFALEAVSRASCPESSRHLFVNICGCTRASAEYWFNVRHPSTINPLCLHLFKPQSVFQWGQVGYMFIKFIGLLYCLSPLSWFWLAKRHYFFKALVLQSVYGVSGCFLLALSKIIAIPTVIGSQKCERIITME